jgi:hypothetical protein
VGTHEVLAPEDRVLLVPDDRLAGAERILASRRERGATLAEIAEALAMVQGARRDIAWWQRRLDAIECPEA